MAYKMYPSAIQNMTFQKALNFRKAKHKNPPLRNSAPKMPAAPGWVYISAGILTHGSKPSYAFPEIHIQWQYVGTLSVYSCGGS